MEYQNGKIYIIKNYVNDLVYIGSTKQTLEKRFNKHKAEINTKKGQTIKLYQAMRELGKQNFYIEEIKKYPCETKQQLIAREGHFIRLFDSFNNGYNKRVAGRDMKQWTEDNKDKKKEMDKKYAEQNKEKIAENNKLWREKNIDLLKEKRKEYVKQHKEDIQEYQNNYRINNLEKKKENDKIYAQQNKEKIKEQKQQPFECECGKTVSWAVKARHFKSQKHQSFIENTRVEKQL
jgi:hypothetical protein